MPEDGSAAGAAVPVAAGIAVLGGLGAALCLTAERTSVDVAGYALLAVGLLAAAVAVLSSPRPAGRRRVALHLRLLGVAGVLATAGAVVASRMPAQTAAVAPLLVAAPMLTMAARLAGLSRSRDRG